MECLKKISEESSEVMVGRREMLQHKSPPAQKETIRKHFDFQGRVNFYLLCPEIQNKTKPRRLESSSEYLSYQGGKPKIHDTPISQKVDPSFSEC